MRELNKRERVIFILCIMVISVFIVNLVIVKPIKGLTNDLDAEIEKSKRQLERQLMVIEKSKSIAKEFEQSLEGYRQTVSDEQAMSSFLASIELTAREIGMRVSDVKPKRVRKIDFYNHFSVSLSINGPLKDIAQFLYVLQNDPLLFSIDEIILEKNSPQVPTMDCRLVLSKTLIP